MIKKKIIYYYTIFFILLFIILSSLNFIYKKYIVNHEVMNAYNVRAIQFYNFKSDSLKPVLNEIFKKHSKIYKEYYIEDMSIYLVEYLIDISLFLLIGILDN